MNRSGRQWWDRMAASTAAFHGTARGPGKATPNTAAWFPAAAKVLDSPTLVKNSVREDWRVGVRGPEPEGATPGLTHEGAKEGVVACPKDKKDGKDGKDTVCHDSSMFCCFSCVNPGMMKAKCCLRKRALLWRRPVLRSASYGGHFCRLGRQKWRRGRDSNPRLPYDNV